MKFSSVHLLILLGNVQSFVAPRRMFGVKSSLYLETASAVAEKVAETEQSNDADGELSASVRAPLKYLGPYPALSLRFPNLSTASQRQRNVTGVSLDFVLDTAANVNTINSQVAQELGLEVVGKAPPGLRAGGAMGGGETFMLGTCELEGLSEEPFAFMTDLTASALPVASPASAGLLSTAFFNCFEGGVEFNWGKVEDGKVVEYPAITFHGEDSEHLLLDAKSRATITPLPVTLLPSIKVKVNGVEMPALLDTGSPVTVLNAQAAKAAGVNLMEVPALDATANPFAKVANNFKLAQAASRGHVLTLASSTGQPIQLVLSNGPANVSVVGDNDEDIEFGLSNLYVGDLPGLAAMNGIGVDAPPAVVLGMDVLQKQSKMLYRGQQNEVYFG